MLNTNQKILKFLMILLAFSILTGLIIQLFNYVESSLLKNPVGYYSLGLLSNLLGAGVIVVILSISYYLLKLIPKVRNSTTFAGISIVILAYLIFTTLRFTTSLGPFNPFEGKFILSIILRFGITFFIPHFDRYITKRMVNKAIL